MIAKFCATAFFATAMAAASLALPAEAKASCFAANGRTSADGNCIAGVGSVAIVLGQVSGSKANGRNSFALTIGNGSTTALDSGDRNVGITIGNNSNNATTLGQGGNKLVVLGDNSLINNLGGGGNNYTVRGNGSQINSISKTANNVTVVGNGSSASVQSNGRRAVARGNNVSTSVG